MDESDPNPLRDNPFKESELETLGSLERELPVELSFLIRQQAYCMARMNYLDRQIRELKSDQTNKQGTSNTLASASTSNSQLRLANNNTNQSYYQNNQTCTSHNHLHHHHQQQQLQLQQQQHLIRANNLAAQTAILSNHNHAIPTTSSKIGNGFIPSDDSGGEYSRATISDDDELSSLLDQIAKSVKPVDHNQLLTSNQHQRQASANLHPQQNLIFANQVAQLSTLPTLATLPQRSNHHHQYSVISNHQPYAIINPNQLQHHHQAVPVFVMGSPITTAHPASSISSTVLPGVHFQPEPRYNQYYEDFYTQANNNNNNNINLQHQPTTTSSMINTRHNSSGSNGLSRSRQFDSSISAIEQLISQKEKRQIKSQLKSADNWLKMRSAGVCNLNEFGTTSNNRLDGSATNSNASEIEDKNVSTTTTTKANIPASASANTITGATTSNQQHPNDHNGNNTNSSVIECNRSR